MGRFFHPDDSVSWQGTPGARLFIPRRREVTVSFFCPAILQDVTGTGTTLEEALGHVESIIQSRLADWDRGGAPWTKPIGR